MTVTIEIKGPPASGKTRLIFDIVERYNGEILSHDEIEGGESATIKFNNGATS